MPIDAADQTTPFSMPGSRIRCYVSPSRGSHELCAWEYVVEPGVIALPHRPSREEVFLVQAGALHGALDHDAFALMPGDVPVVPAGSELRVDGGSSGARAWVTTSVGVRASTATGTVDPPWAQ